MHRLRTVAIITCLASLLIAPAHAQGASPGAQWAVRLADGADPDAVAAQVGARNLGRIGQLDYYLFAHGGQPARALPSPTAPAILAAEPVTPQPVAPMTPSDPTFPDQWHLHNTGQGTATAGNDANVLPAWDLGFTGAGVDIGIVEDNFNETHPDLAPNYDAAHSIFGPLLNNAHATAAAGVAAANDDGTACGVGAAYDASLATLTWSEIIEGSYQITNAAIARAWTAHYDVTDIYSNSWGYLGPYQPIGRLMEDSLIDGVTNGRGGLGAIYVIAAGNGRSEKLSDDGDPYNNDDTNDSAVVASRYTIGVAASSADGDYSGYSSPGSAVLVNAPSSGSAGGAFMGVPTTDVAGSTGYTSGDCHPAFSGTSAATPLAAGVIALMLQANPDLTWRDVQHILVHTAAQNDPTHPGWVTNGAGHTVSHDYGHGRIDAGAAVNAALGWSTVEPEQTLRLGQTVEQPIADSAAAEPGTPGAPLTRTIQVPQDLIIEHVEVVIYASHPRRGDLAFTLTSPAGTTSSMLAFRNFDTNADYDGWRLNSTHFWGERAAGTWTLQVADYQSAEAGTLHDWALVFYGTGLLDAPTGLAAAYNPAAAAVELTWLDGSGETGYTVERSTDGGATWTTLTATLAAGSTAYTDREAACGTAYTYRVTATASGRAATSEQAAATTPACPPEAPTRLSAAYEAGAHQVALAWVDNADGETGYLVERRKQAANTWVTLATPGPDADGYRDTTATCDQTYLYRVSTAGGEAALSDPVSTACDVFADVPGSLPAPFMEPWVEDFYQTGITTGCDAEGNFCPEAPVSRGAMAVFLLRAMAYPGAHAPQGDPARLFADVPSPDQPPTFERWIEDFYALGITTGCGLDPLVYCPEAPVTRGAMAVFILRALEGAGYVPEGSSGQTFNDVPSPNQPPAFEAYIEELASRGITTGCDAVGNFCPEAPVTRGAMAVFILRAFEAIPDPDDP